MVCGTKVEDFQMESVHFQRIFTRLWNKVPTFAKDLAKFLQSESIAGNKLS